jgi:hypothetical protein
MALVNAGLGTLAAAGQRDARGLPMSPAAAIGHGGQQGIKTLQEQQAAGLRRLTVEQRAKQLEAEAARHLRQMGETERHNKAIEDRSNFHPTGTESREGHPLLYDARTGKTIDAITRKPVEEDRSLPNVEAQSPATPSGKKADIDDAKIPLNARMAAYDPEGATSPTANPEVLEGLSKPDAELVKAIAEGRRKFLPLQRNNAYNRRIMERVHEYDPQADETDFSRRQRTANFFAVGTQGGGGQNIAAMNTWAQHMDEYLRLTQELGLGRFTTANEAYNFLTAHGFTSKEAQKKLGALSVAQKAVADEGAKVFAGSNSALADRKAWEDRFGLETPANVALAKAKEVQKLVEGRLNSVANQYNEGMKTRHEPSRFIAPKTREIMDRINGAEGDKYETATSGNAPDKNKQALDWANANPKDPRAVEIKKRLGVE